jgi:hypothetical protein
MDFPGPHGSGRPENIRILRIRIRNTGFGEAVGETGSVIEVNNCADRVREYACASTAHLSRLGHQENIASWQIQHYRSAEKDPEIGEQFSL